MKHSTSFHKTSFLVVLFALALFACKKDEPKPFFKITGSENNTWNAKAGGDTIVINFSTNIIAQNLRVNNAESWISHQLGNDGQLVLHVKKNNESHKRTGKISILSTNKGTLLSNEIITVNQPSENPIIEDKALFTYYPKVEYKFESYSQEKKVYKLILPAQGGEVVSEQLFYCNIPKDKLVVKYEYEGENAAAWVKDLEFIEKEGQVVGLRFQAAPLTEGIEQRRVKISVHDQTVPAIQASVVYSQIRHSVEIFDPEKVAQKIPVRPTRLSTLLKTDIPVEKLKLKVGSILFPKKDENSLAVFNELQRDQVYIHNYTPHSFTEYKEVKEQYSFRETAEGVVLEGITTTNGIFFPLSHMLDDNYHCRQLLIISNEINDDICCIFLHVENPKNIFYQYFEDNKKDTTVYLSHQLNNYSLRFRANMKLVDYLFQTISLSCPNWIVIPRRTPSSAPEYKAYYPDIYKMVQDITVLPNSYREKRTGVLKIGEDLNVHFIQDGFVGSYVFKLNKPESKALLLSASASQTPIAIESNLTGSQVKVTKTTSLSGWIDYKVNTDPQTKFVTSITFYVDANSTGEDRAAEYILETPENEGLEKITINVKQSK